MLSHYSCIWFSFYEKKTWKLHVQRREITKLQASFELFKILCHNLCLSASFLVCWKKAIYFVDAKNNLMLDDILNVWQKANKKFKISSLQGFWWKSEQEKHSAFVLALSCHIIMYVTSKSDITLTKLFITFATWRQLS